MPGAFHYQQLTLTIKLAMEYLVIKYLLAA